MINSDSPPDVTKGRLASYNGVFCDLHPALDWKRARIESDRCFYCYDAPCIRACPTEINIPSFIRKIGNGNVRGAAIDILSANILGGTCARVCPTEVLCQQACVREKSEQKPVMIGELQRFATDELFKSGEKIFTRPPSNGIKVAVVGAGPAGLSCAHRLARWGYDVTIFEAKKKAGGLNEYGLAPYKVADGFVQKEIDFILGLGGIEVRYGEALGKSLRLEDLREEFSAVFLGVGLDSVNSLNIQGEDLPQVNDAVRFIETIRQSKDLSQIPVGRHVVVIGGGNTAIDIAIQMKRLGAEFVTLAYRRGEDQMGATVYERKLARQEGVMIKTWLKPQRVDGGPTGVDQIEFEYSELDPSGKLKGTGRFLTLKADQIFKAIGQTLTEGQSSFPKVKNGKFVVGDSFETSIPGVYAGGDCVDRGEDLTVTAVQHGKLAAEAIHQKHGGRHG